MSSLAADTREAARRHPFLLTALRAGVVNYTAAARFLADEIGHEETDPVVTALRRFADELPPYETGMRDVRVTMESGVGPIGESEETLFSLGGIGFGPDAGSKTAILARGEADPAGLASALSLLRTREVSVDAAGTADGVLVVVVERRDGANALRAVEDALSAVPE